MTTSPESSPDPAAPAGRRRWFTAPDGYALFVGHDEQTYFHQNADPSPANVAWACTAVAPPNWHPLTLLAERTISTLFGPRAGAFRAVQAVHAPRGRPLTPWDFSTAQPPIRLRPGPETSR